MFSSQFNGGKDPACSGLLNQHMCSYPGCTDPTIENTLIDTCWFDGLLAENNLLVVNHSGLVHLHNVRVTAWVQDPELTATEMKVIDSLQVLDNWVTPKQGPLPLEDDPMAWKRPVVRAVMTLIEGRDALVVEALTTGDEGTRTARALELLGAEESA